MDNNFNNGFGMPQQPDSDSMATVQVPDMGQMQQQPEQPAMDTPVFTMAQQQPADSLGQQPANPFGQQANTFNQQQTNPFGQQANTFNQQQANPFGQQANTFNQQQANPYGQPATPYMQPADPYAQPYVQTTAPKKAKKGLSGGAIAGIICGGLALVAAIICAIIFIPKLFGSPKDKVVDACKNTFAASKDAENGYVATLLGGDKFAENAKNDGVTVAASLYDVNGSGTSVDLTFGYDYTDKQAGGELLLNMMGSELLKAQLYANADTTYFGIPNLIDGYFTIPNVGGLTALANNPMFEGMDTSSLSGDLNWFPEEVNTTNVNPEAVKAIDELWDKVEYKKKGKAKVDVNGETLSTTEYTATLSKNDLQDAVSSFVDLAIENASSTSQGAELQAYGPTIKQLIPTFITKDLVFNIYVKDEKVVKIVCDDTINIMGSKFDYNFFLDITDDISGKAEISAAGETFGVRFEFKNYKNAPSGEIAVYGSGKEYKITVNTTNIDDANNKNFKLALAIFDGSNEVGSFNMNYELNKADNAITFGGNLVADGKQIVSVDGTGKIENVVEGKSITFNFDKINVTAQGQTVSVGFKLTLDAEATVPQIDMSKKMYDLTTITEDQLTNIIEENEDLISSFSALLGVEDNNSDNENDQIETTENNDEMLLQFIGDEKKVKILGSLPEYEMTFNCLYFIDFENHEKFVNLEYQVAENKSVEEILADLTWIEEDAITGVEDNLTVTISDGTELTYKHLAVDMFGTGSITNLYLFVRPLEDGRYLTLRVQFNENAATVEEVAEALNAMYFEYN